MTIFCHTWGCPHYARARPILETTRAGTCQGCGGAVYPWPPETHAMSTQVDDASSTDE